MDFQLTTLNYPDNELVYSSKKINPIAEWRCFVLNREVIGIVHYTGDFTAFPCTSEIEAMVEAYDNATSAYSLDIWIERTASSYNTFVMEVNDVMSLGWYGFNPQKAAKMLETRWEQIHAEKHT